MLFAYLFASIFIFIAYFTMIFYLFYIILDFKWNKKSICYTMMSFVIYLFLFLYMYTFLEFLGKFDCNFILVFYFKEVIF